MKFVKYEPETGRIISSGDIPETMLYAQGENILVGEGYAQTHYVEHGQICLKPECPGAFYEFDYINKTWLPNLTLMTIAERTKRDRIIQSTDWTQLPDVPLETKTVWASYRQALRDITKQPGFPTEVIYPSVPE